MPRCITLAFNLEETQFFFDAVKDTSIRWAFTANHAHLVPDGVEGFLRGMDIARCDEVRLADCWRNGKEIHLSPGEAISTSSTCSAGSTSFGFQGHYMNAFGSLEDMIKGRDVLSQQMEEAVGSA